MNHTFYTGKDLVGKEDTPFYRSIVDGGLSVCKVCGLGESCLTTECPGMNACGDIADAVYAGRLDFLDGQWQQKANPTNQMWQRWKGLREENSATQAR
ncbi:hypothetical protein [Burkholderia sp. MBR-1]|uniref:hypothetical protein n=1 Tax=Burkholderia sp. MBR-1 TaxID=2732364 RepID=UPI0015EE3D1F|nr:hypothetical protein [Burkholderia sp. MBR-1]QMI49724.1 hypothetical protein MBR110_30075 [Burkholderia sp. MBR-1]